MYGWKIGLILKQKYVSFNTYISELFLGIFSEKLKQFQMEKGKKYFCIWKGLSSPPY